MNDFIPLARVPREIALLTTDGATRTYAAVYRAALNGAIPVHQGFNGRYSVDRDRLPEIARVLGLDVRTSVATK
jgi:hypothetical protein